MYIVLPCMCVQCLWSLGVGAPLELELQVIVSHHEGAKN